MIYHQRLCLFSRHLLSYGHLSWNSDLHKVVQCFYSHLFAGLKAESSSNVFMENLHNTKDLTTTYYVTDNKQATDFFWFRESGIRVNIGITNVNIIPEYVDVDYQSDNMFMVGNPNTIEEKTKFKKITQNFCRWEFWRIGKTYGTNLKEWF